MSGPLYTFALRRSPDGKGYVGEVIDKFGWVISLKADVVDKNGTREFAGVGELGPTPPSLILPGEDAMRNPVPLEGKDARFTAA